MARGPSHRRAKTAVAVDPVDHAIRATAYHPLASDVVRVDVHEGLLSIATRAPRLAHAYREAIGHELFGDRDCSSTAPTFTLAPLADRGRAALDVGAFAAQISDVRLVEVTFDTQARELETLSGHDCFGALERRGLSTHGADVRVARVRFSTRAGFTVWAPHAARIPKGEHAPLVREVIRALGFLAPLSTSPQALSAGHETPSSHDGAVSVKELSPATVVHAVAQLQALADVVKAVVGNTEAKDRRRGLKFRAGGETVLPVLVNAVAQHPIALPMSPMTEAMQTRMQYAHLVKPAAATAKQLAELFADVERQAESDTWQLATAVYTSLRRLSLEDPALKLSLAQAVAFFKTGPRVPGGKARASRTKKPSSPVASTSVVANGAANANANGNGGGIGAGTACASFTGETRSTISPRRTARRASSPARTFERSRSRERWRSRWRAIPKSAWSPPPPAACSSSTATPGTPVVATTAAARAASCKW